jgi:hypothetical protein
MSKPVTIPDSFATQTGPIPLSQLDADFSALATSVNDMATYGNYLVDSSGSVNLITCTAAAGLAFAYTAGMGIQVSLANTTTSTTVNINVNGLGNKAVINADGTLPAPGLLAGTILPLVYDGTSFRILLAARTQSLLFKAANTSRASNATLSNDPDLITPTLAAGTYIFEICFAYSYPSGGSSGGIQWSMPFTGTLASSPYVNFVNPLGINTNTNAAGSLISATILIGSTGVTFAPSSGSVPLAGTTFAKFSLVVTASGVLSLSWAQQVSGTGPTVVYAGSYMTYQKIA